MHIVRSSARVSSTYAGRRLPAIRGCRLSPPKPVNQHQMEASTFMRLTGKLPGNSCQGPDQWRRLFQPRIRFSPARSLRYPRFSRRFPARTFPGTSDVSFNSDRLSSSGWSRATEESNSQISYSAAPRSVKSTSRSVVQEEFRAGLACPICLSRFRGREQGVGYRKCGHEFHKECLSPWFAQKNTCQVCRLDIDEGRSVRSFGK
jgi:hypothetical protein